MSKLFGGSTNDYTPTPCRIERIDGDDFIYMENAEWINTDVEGLADE